MSVSPTDDCTSQAEQSKVAEIGLLVANKDLAEPVQPRVAGLHYPATCTVSGNMALLLSLLSPCFYMRGVATSHHSLVSPFSCVAFVSTEMLWGFRSHLGSLSHDTIQDWFQLRDIMSMCPGYDE
jgi:hypothetical protein